MADQHDNPTDAEDDSVPEDSQEILPVTERPALPRLPILIVLLCLAALFSLYLLFRNPQANQPDDPLQSIQRQPTEDAEKEDTTAAQNLLNELDQLAQRLEDTSPPPQPAPDDILDLGVTTDTRASGNNLMARLTTPKIVSLSAPSATQVTAPAQPQDPFNLQQIESTLQQLEGNQPPQDPPPATQNTGWLSTSPATTAAQIEATRIDDMEFTILESTSIPITIAQAINSELPGRVAATVTQNVWSADGSRILIPRLTRAIGQYQATQVQGTARIFILWNRLIDPYGLNIPVQSSTTDRQGFAGISGDIDTNFWQRFGGSILISVIGGFAQEGSENENQRQYYAQSFNQAASIALENTINIPPRITTEPAMPAFIFVQQDINVRRAYRLGLEAKAEQKQRYSDHVRATRNQLNAASQGDRRTMRNLTQLVRIPVFAHPDPHILGLLPQRPQYPSQSEEQNTNVPATQTPQPNILPELIPPPEPVTLDCLEQLDINSGDLLSALVKGYLTQCGAQLAGWPRTPDDDIIDFQFREGAIITLPDTLESLIYLLRSVYSIVLKASDHNPKFFTANHPDANPRPR